MNDVKRLFQTQFLHTLRDFRGRKKLVEARSKHVQLFATFFLSIPIFKEIEDGDFDLFDPRNIKNVDGMKANVLVQLKQSYVSFSSKENPLDRVVHTKIDSFIIGVVLLAEGLEKEQSPVEVFTLRRVFSFEFLFVFSWNLF